MNRLPPRLALACVLLGASAAFSADDGEYARFFKPPVTPAEYWNALKFERKLGSPEVAAKYLRGLLAKTPTDKEFLEISDAEKEGVIAFSRLVAVREWTPDAKANKQARADAEELLKKVQEAIRKRSKDDGYINSLILKLRAETREERTYAVRELARVGVPTVPYLLEEYGRTKSAEERYWIRRTLEGIRGAAGPLLAALDADRDQVAVKLEVLDLLRRKYPALSREIIPFLWFPSANPDEDPSVRAKAKELLADLLELPASRLPSAKSALTREAERFLTRDVRFGDPITIWRWDGKKVVEGLPGGAAISTNKAEEHYGLKFARQALDLDPDYRPAQAAFLRLAIEKATASGGALPDALTTIINKADLPFLLDLLDKALIEQRTAVVLPLVQAIGKRGEVRAKRPLTKGESPLVKALDYPDSRVRLAAVEALLSIPGPPTANTSKRILEVLKNALSPAAAYAPGTKVLVAVGEAGWRARVVRTLANDGMQVVEARSGREAMRLLKADASIQALVTESTLPLPGLAHFLAQIRADIGLKKLPIVLAAVPESRASVEASANFNALSRERDGTLKAAKNFIEDLATAQRERDDDLRLAFRDKTMFPEALREEVARIDARYAKRAKDLTAETSDLVKQLRLLEERQQAVMGATSGGSFTLSESARRELDYIEGKFEKKRASLEKENFILASSYKRLQNLEARMKAEAVRFDVESGIREGSLARFVSRYPGVSVVHAAVLVTPPASESDTGVQPVSLREALSEVRRAGPPQAKPAELGTQAETAMRILHGLATGSPPGYDVAPVGGAVLEALKNGRLTEQGQLYAVGIAARLAGAEPQQELATLVTGNGFVKVRLAAADALIQHLQKYGNVLPVVSLRALDALAAEGKLDAPLKEKAELLNGILRGGTRSTGDGLRDYKPAPPVPVIPPPKEKDKDMEKEKEKDKND